MWSAFNSIYIRFAMCVLSDREEDGVQPALLKVYADDVLVFGVRSCICVSLKYPGGVSTESDVILLCESVLHGV